MLFVCSRQDYYSEGFYPEQNSGLGEQEEAESSTLFNDEAVSLSIQSRSCPCRGSGDAAAA